MPPTFPLNLFSLFDLLGPLTIGPMVAVFVVRSIWITRQKTDLLFAITISIGFLWSLLIFAVDNVVPATVPASTVPGAAARTLLFVRLMYAVGIWMMASTVHFTLRYVGSPQMAGWRTAWLYAGAAALCPLVWSDAFVRLPSAPLGETANWRLAVPWLPTHGTWSFLYGLLWLAAMGYVQWLVWHRRDPTPRRGALAYRGQTVRAGLTVIAVSGLIDLGLTLAGWAGISAGSLVAWLGMLVVGLGLAAEWQSAEREREHVHRRFASYVDPALVQYVLDHPDQARFAGEVRELTVAFSDLESYTPLTERLRENAVPLLNEYLSAMTPLIRENHGYRSKFLGDGIMFFYGAPEWNCDHAMQAVATVLKMQETMVQLNQRLVERGQPALAMRIGVSSGDMVVGDAGSQEASDYTVLGDAVNLGARLETANKYTGTRILVSEGTFKLLPKDLFLLRPIGKLQVVGLSRAVMTYEPLAYTDRATEAQRLSATLTARMVELFARADFRECLETERCLREAIGPGKLGDLYRQHCEKYLAQPPPPGFDGTIVLTEK